MIIITMKSYVACSLILLIILPSILVGVAPDSPLYPIKRLLEDLDLLLTFDDVSKAKKMLEYAKMRLMEADKMADEGKRVDDLLRDYESYMKDVVDLMRSTDPENVPKIAKLIVNESLSDLKELESLSKKVRNVESVEILTIRQDELAIDILKEVSPSDAYELCLNLTKGLLKISKNGLLIEESDRLMKKSEEMLKIARNLNKKGIVEEIREIIDEATSLNNSNATDIIEKGLEIYKKLGLR